MAWKYIMFENKIGETSVMFPVIFPDKMVHSQVAMALRPFMPGWGNGGVVPVSAGKIEHLSVEGLGGDSETLGLASNKEDTKTIENYTYLHGIV